MPLTLPLLTTPPVSPSPSDGPNFATRAYAFLNWWYVDHGPEINEWVAAFNAATPTIEGYASTATTKAAEAVSSAAASAASAASVGTKAAEAAASATAAAGSATAASGSASTASTKAGEAAASATAASASASTATTKAGEASTSATAASGSAGTASTKAGEASTSATAAAGSASTATTKADEAAASATSASGSASTASTAAGTATTAAGTATTKAGEASASASTATTKAAEASQSAVDAAGAQSAVAASASAAAGSATAAAGSATTANTKAGEAAASATTATNKAAEASSASTNANASATTATTKADEASTSAGAAASSATSAGTARNAAEAAAVAAAASAATAASVSDITTHVNTSASESVSAHVLLSDVSPAALGTAAKGVSGKAAKADHVHPTTGIMLDSHAANSVSGFGTEPPAVSPASGAAGTATTVSRGDHTHDLGTHAASHATGQSDAISPANIGAVATSLLTTAGDIIVATAASTPARLGIGSEGQALKVVSGVPAWGDVAAGGGADKWTAVTTFTATPASTSTLTMTADKTADIKTGMPLRYTIGGTAYYGICTAITSGLLTVAGAPISGSVTALAYSIFPGMVEVIQIMLPGYWADSADTSLILNDLVSPWVWAKAPAALVQIKAYTRITDTGGTYPRINARIGSTTTDYVSTSNSNAGLSLAASATWYSTVVDIDVAKYGVASGQTVELKTDANGGNDNAADLSVVLIFVYA